MGQDAVEGTVAWLMQFPPDRRRRLALQLFYSRGTPKQTRRMASEVLARVQILIETVRKHACSMSRYIAHVDHGEHHKVCGMRISRYGSRIGDAPGVLETRRWTPPQAVTLEDRYDAMDPIEAAACRDPPSVTGIQMQQIQMRNGRLERPKPPKRKKKKKGASTGHRVPRA